MGYPITQSSTAQPLVFFMTDSADHLTGKTGLSPTVTLSKNGGSFASPAGAVSEIASGWYKVAGNATDSGTLGPLLLHATASGADAFDDCFAVVAYSPQSATSLGLSNLDAAITSRMATYTQPTGFLAATFPGTVASTTNITAGTITTVTTLTNLPTAPTDWLSAAAVSAAAVTKIQAGLSTYAGSDTSGTTTLLARLTALRAGYLDNLSAGAVMLASSYSAPPAATAIADVVFGRSVSFVESTAAEHSLCSIILATLESSMTGTSWDIRKTGGGAYLTKTLTVDAAADPITGVT